MGQVYVIRKEAGVALSPGGIQQIWMPGQSNEPQRFAGVTGGIGNLQRHPVTNQYEAAPIMSEPDDKGRQTELGHRAGDIYGARGLNINPKFNQNLSFGPVTAEQAPIHEAQQRVFDRSARYGQTGANVGRGLAAGIGVLAGAVNLANAGAQGQDAITGGLGAAQMGSMAYQQGKKPLAEAGGEVGAQVGARSVGVTKPEVASPNPVAVAPPTNTHTEDEMTNMRSGKEVTMSTDRHGNPVPFTSEAARRGAKHRSDLNIGRNVDPDTNQSPVDHMGMPTAVGVEETGMVTGGGDQSTWPTGSQQGDEQAQAAANKVQVAPATTNTSQQTVSQSAAAIAAETGQGQLPGAPDPNANSAAADVIAANTTAAEAMSGKKPSSTDHSIVNQSFNPMRFIGVI